MHISAPTFEFCVFFLIDFFFKFSVHNSIEQKEQRFPIHPPCPPCHRHSLPHCHHPAPDCVFAAVGEPTLTDQNQPVCNRHWRSLLVVYKCMTQIRHYGTIHRTVITLKPSALLFLPTPAPGTSADLFTIAIVLPFPKSHGAGHSS